MRPKPFNLRLIGAIVGLAGIMAGCASTSYRMPMVPPGATLEIRQTLEVPYGSARVFIQGGRVITEENINHWAVYCSVQTRPIRQAGQTQTKVEPGRFDIYEVRQFNDINRTGRVYTAALMSGFDEWPAFIIFQVEMRLKSVEQPAVRALFCAKNGDLMYGYSAVSRYPNLAEIRATLGDLADIVTP